MLLMCQQTSIREGLIICCSDEKSVEILALANLSSTSVVVAKFWYAMTNVKTKSVFCFNLGITSEFFCLPYSIYAEV